MFGIARWPLNFKAATDHADFRGFSNFIGFDPRKSA
jgi:hypothetical protein